MTPDGWLSWFEEAQAIVAAWERASGKLLPVNDAHVLAEGIARGLERAFERGKDV